jgi:hypothetical protein
MAIIAPPFALLLVMSARAVFWQRLGVAGAVFEVAPSTPQGLELLDTMVVSDPGGAHLVTIPVGGMFAQQGRAVQKFAITKTVEITAALLQRNGLTTRDIRYFIGHQANLRMLTSVGSAPRARSRPTPVQRRQPWQSRRCRRTECRVNAFGIATNDIRGTSTDHQLEKLIIPGISAGSDLFRWLYEERSFNKGDKKFFALGSGHIARKLFTLMHLGQFLEGGGRQQHTPTAQCAVQSLPWL